MAKQGASWVEKNAGTIANQAKPYVPIVAKIATPILDAGIMAGATYIGAPELAPGAIALTNAGINNGVKSYEATDWQQRNGWNQFGNNMLDNTIQSTTSAGKKYATQKIDSTVNNYLKPA